MKIITVYAAMVLCAGASACTTTRDEPVDTLGVVAAAPLPDSTPRDSVTAPPDSTRRDSVKTPPDTATVSQAPGDYVIDAGGIGKIRLGHTLDEARRAVPNASFTRESDGEGVILVGVTVAPDTGMILYADEEDADSIEWAKRLQNIETFSPAFHTAEGVHPGSLVADVEHIYGKVKVILVSEIESRQYVVFEKQPRKMTFRLDYTGEFRDDSRTTTKYQSGAKILSIAVP
jgi:hypothetical protein